MVREIAKHGLDEYLGQYSAVRTATFRNIPVLNQSHSHSRLGTMSALPGSSATRDNAPPSLCLSDIWPRILNMA